jgi:hypothetical protein
MLIRWILHCFLLCFISMNLSAKYKHSPFESFLPGFEATSWPTSSSMSFEVASKPEKKFFKNRILYFADRFIANYENQWELEEKNILKSAQTENRPIVAVFLGDDCPWSKKLRQEILESFYFLEKVNAEAILWIYSLKQDEGEKPFIQKYKVQQCPVFLLLDPQGKEFARLDYVSLDAQGYTEAIVSQIEHFQEICLALDQGEADFDEQKWQELYQKAKKLSVPCFHQVILERGLHKEKGHYFHLEKFATLLEKHKINHFHVRKAKQQLLNRDPDNTFGMHFKVAVLEFQKIVSRSKPKDRPEKALSPLLQYVHRFGKKDVENYWKSELMIAEFLYRNKLILSALEHAEAAYQSSPETTKPQIAEMISLMKQDFK